jgi:hypothetical protein
MHEEVGGVGITAIESSILVRGLIGVRNLEIAAEQ